MAAADGNDDHIIAELEVTSVAETSAVTDVHTPKRDISPGDLAYLSSQDEQALVQQSTLSATRKYPTVISFTEGDTLDEEARAVVPKPPMPSVNRARGRIGIDYMGTSFHGAAGGTSMNLGLVARMDMTRIAGTYWNLSGYWRGRLNKNSYSNTQTIPGHDQPDVSLEHDLRQSQFKAGGGVRPHVPALGVSLDTIDGGYFGARLGHGSTMGVFAGSTPDPTSWSYNPDRRIGGLFVNFEGGRLRQFPLFQHFGNRRQHDQGEARPAIRVLREHGSPTSDMCRFTTHCRQIAPPETRPWRRPGQASDGIFSLSGSSRIERIELDANYNYFRDLPTFDPTLIGTSLLDKYLFQGFSAGVRLEV